MDLGESSTFFRIRCLEFYFPRHSVASLSLSLFPFLSRSLFSATFSLFPVRIIFLFLFLPSAPILSLPCRGSLCWASARFYPAFRDWRHLSWMDRQSSFTLLPPPPRTYHPSPECCSTPSPRCLFAHSMGDYTVSEFTHSRKVRALRDILRVIAPC